MDPGSTATSTARSTAPATNMTPLTAAARQNRRARGDPRRLFASCQDRPAKRAKHAAWVTQDVIAGAGPVRITTVAVTKIPRSTHSQGLASAPPAGPALLPSSAAVKPS